MSAAGNVAKPRWRRWLQRIGLGLVAFVVLLTIFHRPLFFEGTRYFIVRAAKQQHLDLSYEVSGSIFTTLSISNLRGTPTEPGPVQRLEIGTLNLRYSLIGLFRHGLPGFLKLVDLRNAYIEITPGEPLPPEKEKEPQQLKFPALFPDLLNIENFNFIAHGANGSTELAGLFLSLLPDRSGILKIEALDIPGVRRWTGISGATTFRDRNLMLTDLEIGPEIALRSFNLDASKLDAGELALGLDGELFNARTTITARVSDLNATNRLNVKADIAGLFFDDLWKYLNLSIPLRGAVERLALTFEGEPGKPSGWSGNGDGQLSGVAYDRQPLGDMSLGVKLGNKQARIELSDRLDQENHIHLEADFALPETLNDFAKTSGAGRLEVFAPDLVALSLPVDIIGDLTVNTDLQIVNGKLSAQAVFDSSALILPGTEATEAHFTASLEKDLAASPDAPFFETLVTHLDGGIKSLRLKNYVVDSLTLALSIREADVSLESLTFAKAANTASLQGTYSLPADLKSWDAQPLDFDAVIDAPDLSAFVAPESRANVKGALKVVGKGSARDRIYNGSFLITGRNVEVQEVPMRTLDARLDVVGNQAQLSQFDLVFDDKNSIRGGGNMQLAKPFGYDASLDVQLKDLSHFQPLLAYEALPPRLGGSLRLTWQGKGDLGAPEHAGDAVIELIAGQFGELKDLSARATASYSPESFNVPDLRAAAGNFGDATLSLFWRDNRLSVSNLSIRQKKLALLEGSAEIPLHLAEASQPDRLIPDGEPLKLAFRSKDLDLGSLFVQLGEKKPPVTGVINLDVNAEGTLDDLIASANLRATRIQSTEAERFAPADGSLDLEFRGDRLRLNGEVRQKLIEPLRIAGNIPFDIPAIRKNRQIDPQTPIDVRVSMPRSSLDFISTLVPAIRQSRGTGTVDVNVGGTFGQPSLSGGIAADLTALRFADPILPPISNTAVRINFTRDRVTIDRLSVGLGGGSLNAGGSVILTPLNNPVFDIRLNGRNALIVQNDLISVRASADLRLSGPLNAASVTGNLFVTRSGFFKDIDILPIGLPGRPAPQPPLQPLLISFPDPPLRDWKFDVAIRTADPFRVQSNLANGRITGNLTFGGTGLEPWLDGTLYVEKLTATLPFSQLQIDSSIIYFSRDDPFMPHFELRGLSNIRDYRINVYITGPLTRPEAIFSSDPPLPQSEIVALIATGSTTRELSSDPNVLAGRAAILLLQKLYRSVFRRNKPPVEGDSFLSRVQFDLGAIDPRTGKQTATLGIPLSDQFVLVGGLGVGGNFRGQIKYLLRFK
ncbi:MAG TPA: translocation/assembly module TamB domain-containing protein [Terrimicrobiaceae bacterium]